MGLLANWAPESQLRSSETPAFQKLIEKKTLTN